MSSIDLLSIITIAFLGSFGHCLGMCGGIVLAYSNTKLQEDWSKGIQSLSHILYSLGRVTTYTTLGALFGYLGSVTTFNNTTNGILWLVAGAIMVLTGLSLLGKLKFLTVIEHSVTSTSWYQKSFKSLLQSNSFSSFYFLGMLNGLLPCGFVYFFAVTAASTADPMYGALTMFIFGLSTIPALFSLGFFVTIFKKTEFRAIMVKLAALAVIGYGGYTLYNGYTYITNKDKTVLECH